MPLYDYECLACSNIFELRQSFTDDPVGTCPKCQSHSRRKFVAVPIIYKGSGFYTTDYKNNHASSPDYSKDSSSKGEESSKSESTAASTDKSAKEPTAKESSADQA